MDQILKFCRVFVANFYMEKRIGQKKCMPALIKISQYLAGQMDFCVKNDKNLYSIAYIFTPGGHRTEKLIVYPRGVVDL